MEHSLHGGITAYGKTHRFDGGKGYIEKDSGISFPSSYQWLQCNDFTEPCSVIISIAEIPFGPLRFTGCISAVVHRGREYRLATNVETFIIGLCSGVLGGGLSILLTIPINEIIHALLGAETVSANLPIGYSLILIVISVVITMIGGLMPARKAAKKDPVTALRTE